MKIDWNKLKQQSTQHIGFNVLVLLCAVLALTFLILTVVSAFSVQTNEGIAVKEVFDVSSAPLDAENQSFVSQLTGSLVNYENEQAKVERIIVVVGNGRERAEVELDGVTLYPRLAEEIRYDWKTSFDFDRVYSVTAVVNGEHISLANSTAEWSFNPNILLYGLLCALSCIGTVFTFKKRYYRYQEDEIEARKAEPKQADDVIIEKKTHS